MATQTETRGRPTKGIGRAYELYIHANEYTTWSPFVCFLFFCFFVVCSVHLRNLHLIWKIVYRYPYEWPFNPINPFPRSPSLFMNLLYHSPHMRPFSNYYIVHTSYNSYENKTIFHPILQ
jgi:hypothetical protein